MKIHIEEAQSEDAARLVFLLGQLGYPASHSEMVDKIQLHKNPTYKLFVAKEENQVMGFIALHFYHAFHHLAPIGRITAFCVDEPVRGSGIGNLLLGAAEGFFHQQQCFKIEVTSNLKRSSTHQYYQQRGYTETSRHFVKIFGKKNS
ncbi:MAG: GNAT family N-acetyltransferase [Cyclobacteriaceae bacterium]